MPSAVRVFSEVMGEAVELPDKPKRIVSLSPSITETLFEMGLGDRVAGVTVYCHRPPEAMLKPRVAAYTGVLVDRLRGVNPDLILTTTGVQRGLINEVKAIAPTYPIPIPVTIYGVLDFVKKVALVVNELDRGEELAIELLRTLTEYAKACPPLRTYVEIEFEEPYTAGAHTYVDSMLRLLGLRNIYGDEPRAYFSLGRGTIEVDLAIYDPKPIGRKRGSEEVVNWLKARGIKARAYLITEGDELAHHGPYLIRVTLRKIAETCNKLH